MYGWPKSCYLQVCDAPNRAEDAGDLIRRVPQRLQVGPEELDGRFRAHPRNQFVHPLLDRLANQKAGARHPCQPLAD